MDVYFEPFEQVQIIESVYGKFPIARSDSSNAVKISLNFASNLSR